MASKRQKVHQPMDSAPATSDLISDLPADVTMNILLRLPLQEAVRTSLLSKRWRYKWITIPHLIFIPSTFSPVSKLVYTSDRLFIIHQVLLQHEGPISRFQLVVPHLQSCPKIDPLISFLSRRNIEEFTLMWKGNHKIPSHLFSCLKMRLLHLHGCVLNPPPPDFAGFAKLTSLELGSVDLPASFAETFVARCPLLQRLILRKCTNLDSVDFYAPNLQGLWYHGQISSVCFKNTPSLKIVYIESDNYLNIRNTWIDTFRSLPSLETLRLGRRFCLMLDAGDKVASPLNCLVTLELYLCTGITRGGALSLIKSSPNLQKLELHFHGQKEIDAAVIQLSKAKETWDGSLEKLQSIEILHFSGLKSHMMLIELLLAKSPMLETMRVWYLKGWSEEENKISALEQINQVQRASPRAKLIFSPPRVK